MTACFHPVGCMLGALLMLAIGIVPAAAQDARPAPPDTIRSRQALVSADTLVGAAEDYNELLGHVFVQQDSTLLQSQRALEYVTRKTLFFTGNVLIVERGDTLRADSVHYDQRTKVGHARGRVFLTDGDVEVRAPSAVYYANEKRTRFEEGVTLVDSAATITSRSGTYWSDEKRAELDGDVVMHAERTYLEADSLTYFRETEVSLASGNVFIERLGGGEESDADSTLRTLLFSQWAFNDQQAGLSRVRGHPLLVQLRQDSTDADVDTLIIQAVHLEALEQDTLLRLIAVDSVRIWKTDLAAVADSIVYERLKVAADTSAAETAPADSGAVDPIEETRLFRSPMLWVGEAQVSGDTLRVKGRRNAIDSLFVRRTAFVAQRDTLTGRIHQLKGRHLVGVFEDDSTRVFTVGPNAETIYFQRDEQDRPDGGLQVSGDQAVFRFRGDKPQDIAFGEHEGTYYPEHLLPKPFALEGFLWVPERRPAKAPLLRDERVRERLAQYARPHRETSPASDPDAPTEADAAGRTPAPNQR